MIDLIVNSSFRYPIQEIEIEKKKIDVNVNLQIPTINAMSETTHSAAAQ
ncbi:MAG: hypothetical protein INR71_09590 [Terriglobus roseus]|nr:hypothetical protein [Terriglobus roseus]